MDRPTITLSMIVKNEESRLPECLRAASPWVDEIVVVDTGSSDRTIEIAKEFGATVIEDHWDDDFARVRNLGIEAANSDWILVLDADEVMSEATGASIHRQIKDEKAISGWLPLKSLVDEHEEVTVLLTRLFRNDPRIRFRYRIHEQVLMDINHLIETEGWHTTVCGGQVLHTGYLAEERESKGKTERNERIFLKQLEETPQDLYMLYMYADFLRRYKKDLEGATIWLEKTWEIIKNLDENQLLSFTFTGEVCGVLAMLVANGGDHDRGWEIANFGIENCRPSAHLLFIHGRIALGQQQPEIAERSFRTCMKMGEAPMLLPAASIITGAATQLGIARALHMQGRYEEASPLAFAAIEHDELSSEAIMTWADCEMSLGNWKALTEGLIKRVETNPTCGMSWFKGGEVLFRLRLFNKALPWLLRSGELLEEPAPAHYLSGQAMLALGHAEEAVDLFAAGLPSKSCEAGLMLLAIAYDLELDAPLDPEDIPLMQAFGSLVASLEHFGTVRVNELITAARERIKAFDPKTRRFLETALWPQDADASDAADPSPAPPMREDSSSEQWSSMNEF